MKRNYKIVILVGLLSVALWSFLPKQKIESDPEKDKMLLELLSFILEKGHYSPIKMDDTFSKGVYKDYINALDPSKRFFLQEDIDDFEKYETLIDNQVNDKELAFFDLTYSRLMKRMNECQAYYREALEQPFDYKKNESISTDYENLPYVKTKSELKERWRLQVKLSALSSLVEKQNTQDEMVKNPEKNKDFKIKTFEELEKEVRATTLKNLDDNFSFIKELGRDDWFSIYINAIVSRFDPHTAYLAPEDKEKFDVSMSGKLEGIGARLQKEGDYTKITELISGGPAWRAKQLEAGDLVIKVAQGKNDPVDVVGMRLDDVVKKIKGPKGTEVRLTVKKPDGSIKVYSIIRDQVEIEETYVKSSTVVIDGIKYGIIYLPKFYIDFSDKEARDAGKDVALEVDRLKKDGIQGIIMDVRDNGGGSLKTVVDIAGLFIDQGPIVQVKSAEGKQEVLYDRDAQVQWDGPLVVMINEFSASASEILAAAIQDYKRGVVVGSKQSYGKGTVQNIYDLNQLVRGNTNGDFGSIKITTQKFYRINGGSTQREGVKSDIVMPDKYEFLKMGEKDVENAMAWDKIEPAKYTTWDKQINFDYAVSQSKARLQNNNFMQLIQDNAKWLDQRNKEYTYNLNIDKFKAEQKTLEEKNKKYKPLSDYKNTLEFKSLPYEDEKVKDDPVLKEKRDRWHENLSKDIYIEEALHILSDMNTGNKTSVTTKTKSEKLVKS
jgi:carboxyl-terminal processing protease